MSGYYRKFYKEMRKSRMERVWEFILGGCGLIVVMLCMGWVMWVID